MTNYLILLPPSEGKKIGGDETKPYRISQNFKKYNHFISLNNFREYIFDEVKKIISLNKNIEELEKIFELKDKKLNSAIEINLNILDEKTMPAILRYDGVMFKSINYENLSKKQKENFDNSVLFIDGKFGLLKPKDLIPNYKLKLSSKINDLNLINYWKNNLRPIFKYLFKEKIIIDLLPQLHKKVIIEDSEYNIISINFCKLVDKKIKNVGHDSKKLKGDLIKYIIEKENITIDEIKKFKHIEGFKFSEKYSTEGKVVYLK